MLQEERATSNAIAISKDRFIVFGYVRTKVGKIVERIEFQKELQGYRKKLQSYRVTERELQRFRVTELQNELQGFSVSEKKLQSYNVETLKH